MKKQKKQKPRTKAPHTPHGNAALSRGVSSTKKSSTGVTGWRGQDNSKFARQASVPLARQSPYRGALAMASTYSTDDRQALGLLMLPFLLLAFAVGSSHSLRWQHGYDTPMTAPVAFARPATPATLQNQTIVAANRADVPSLSAAPAAPALAPGKTASADLVVVGAGNRVPAVAPDDVSADARIDQSLIPALPAPSDLIPETAVPVAVATPSRTMDQPATPAPTAELAAVPPAANTALTPAAPEVLARSPADAVVTPANPIELAALAPGLAPPAPGTPVGAAPSPLGHAGRPGDAPPGNVCLPEKPQSVGFSATRLAALGGDTGGGYIDPIAFGMELAAAAREQLDDFTVYTDQYRTIAYPNGDVPPFYGVCTDVIIRAYRVLGVDLQALVHQSKLGSGDTNIDHRRVGTLQKFLARYGETIPISEFAEDYWPGDVISYYRPQNAHSRSHIAIVSDVVGPSGNFMIIHNRGWGPQQEDALFVDQMTGHYRYSAVRRPNTPAVKPKLAASSVKGSAKRSGAGSSGSSGASLSAINSPASRAVAR